MTFTVDGELQCVQNRWGGCLQQ